MGFTFLAFAERESYKPGDVKRPLLREMLVWMIKETEQGAEGPLLREVLVWMMISEKELKPEGAERMNTGISGFLTVEVDAPSLQWGA